MLVRFFEQTQQSWTRSPADRLVALAAEQFDEDSLAEKVIEGNAHRSHVTPHCDIEIKNATEAALDQ